jgi:hypothetical protein
MQNAIACTIDYLLSDIASFPPSCDYPLSVVLEIVSCLLGHFPNRAFVYYTIFILICQYLPTDSLSVLSIDLSSAIRLIRNLYYL